MPAYFAYSYDLVDDFQLPERAFKTLMKWQRPSFDYFFQANPLTRVHLVGSAALMIGTTSELKLALEAMLTNGMAVFTVDESDLMVIHYLRIGNLTRTLTRSLICVASLRGWWGTDNYKIAGTKLGPGTTLKRDPYDRYMEWRPLFHGQRPGGFQTRDLIDIVVPDAEGKGAWLHFRDP